MPDTPEVYYWTGSQTVRMNASGLKEDTLRVSTETLNQKVHFTLVLPTLCITYADMKFQNAVGGLQASYPASTRYGPDYFDPPVEINGEAEIERLTYIRGASRVVIGPNETRIEFPSWKELVIPRMRLDTEKVAEATLSAANVPVQIDEPFVVLLRQYADGRHVGGGSMEVRHPDYRPPQIKPLYNAWVRLLDGLDLKPLVKQPVGIWRWYPHEHGPFGSGVFRLNEKHWTASNGGVEFLNRPAEVWEAVVPEMPGWRAAPRAYLPLAGQPLQMTQRAWKMQPARRPFTWQDSLNLDEMGERCGTDGQAILALNRLHSPGDLRGGMNIILPCFAAALRPGARETIQALAKRFRIEEKELTEANHLHKLSDYNGSFDLLLPGWNFFHAHPSDTLPAFDKMFSLPPGSCIPVERVFRPHPGLLYAWEVVGVPIH